jgi:Major capsid protein Gp23
MLAEINVAEIVKKWEPILEYEGLPSIKDTHKRNMTAILLENTRQALAESGAHSDYRLLSEDPVPVNAIQAGVGGGNIDTFDPILISLIRRTAPNLIAYDLCGVQPMTGPTGLIFALRPMYANTTNGAIGEAWYNEVNTAWSSVVGGANTAADKHVGTLPGNNTTAANLASTGLYNWGGAMSTAQAEALGTDSNAVFAQMSLTIDKTTVTAQSRALKAEYTLEFAQDLKAVHGLDADAELSGILTTEILAEINREVVRTINFTAVVGAQENTTDTGFFNLDTDSNGRWSVEKFKGLMFHIEREANRIAKETRRGKGNLILCSSDVASALQMAGVLDYTPALNSNNLQVDDTGVTFAGVLNGRFKVYIDPYADGMPSFPGLNYMTIGYKGGNAYDAGMFYCPYVPLQKVRAVNPDSFQPKIGFKTRYGMVANPYAQGATLTNQGSILKDSNVYYRRNLVKNLM